MASALPVAAGGSELPGAPSVRRRESPPVEALAVVLALVLIALLGGVVFVFREAGQQLFSGAYRQRISTSEAEARERADALRGVYEDYRSQLVTLQDSRSELEATLVEIRANERASQRERDQLLDQLRRSGEQLDARVESLREQELATLQASAAMPQLSAVAGEDSQELFVRRADILGELYDRLARVEFSIVSLTNPILLPGESFRVPTDLAPELLRWDNWREVGETAFALGEYFNQHRIHLDRTTARAVEACIATVRSTLTQDIYPSLSEQPDADQDRRIRESLAALTIIPRLRRYLEAEYRTFTGIAEPDEIDPVPPSPGGATNATT